MGEPLLYEHFEDILALCAKHNVKLNLTTNGTFPKHGAREWAARIVPVTSDVKDFLERRLQDHARINHVGLEVGRIATQLA